jgi:hypothetical protein
MEVPDTLLTLTASQDSGVGVTVSARQVTRVRHGPAEKASRVQPTNFWFQTQRMSPMLVRVHLDDFQWQDRDFSHLFDIDNLPDQVHLPEIGQNSWRHTLGYEAFGVDVDPMGSVSFMGAAHVCFTFDENTRKLSISSPDGAKLLWNRVSIRPWLQTDLSEGDVLCLGYISPDVLPLDEHDQWPSPLVYRIVGISNLIPPVPLTKKRQREYYSSDDDLQIVSVNGVPVTKDMPNPLLRPQAMEREELEWDVEEEFMCSVCFGVLCVPMSLECSHTHCEECIRAWFVRKAPLKTCPDCQAPVQQPHFVRSFSEMLDKICAKKLKPEDVKIRAAKLQEWHERDRRERDRRERDRRERAAEASAVAATGVINDGVLRDFFQREARAQARRQAPEQVQAHARLQARARVQAQTQAQAQEQARAQARAQAQVILAQLQAVGQPEGQAQARAELHAVLQAPGARRRRQP